MATNQSAKADKYFDVQINVDTRRLDRALEQTPIALREELLDGLDHIRRAFFKAMYYSHKANYSRWLFAEGTGGKGVRLRAYRNPNKNNLLDMELGIFSRSDAVAIHETGGTVSARVSKMLTIPLQYARDPDTGSLKKWFRSGEKKTYADNELFVIRSRKGNLLLVKRSAGKLLPYFLLKKSVTLRPDLRFFQTWETMAGYRHETLNKSVSKALQKTGLA